MPAGLYISEFLFISVTFCHVDIKDFKRSHILKLKLDLVNGLLAPIELLCLNTLNVIQLHIYQCAKY